MAEERRRYSAQQKAKIVREGLSGARPISELCRHYGIAAAQYYDWQKRFLAAAVAGLENKPKNGKRDRSALTQARSQERMTRLHSVIAEITAENLELKKRLGTERDAAL
jgi:transposase-like protein